MKKFFGTNFAIFLSLIFVSCAAKNDQQTKIRIVDLQGKSHPVSTKIPDLNVQALASQGKLQEEQSSFNNMAVSQQEVKIQQVPNQSPIAQTPATSVSEAIATSQKPVANDTMLSAGAVQTKEQTVEYDLSEPEEVVKKSSSKKSVRLRSGVKKLSEPVVVEVAAAKTGKFFAQVGSFSSLENANKTLSSMKKFHQGKVETVDGDKVIYRVLLGPFSNREKAKAMVKKITNSGHEAILVRN